jgi:WS/DGAT/MGAT family acyltransferase
MPETHYERLSFLDNTFLVMEGPTTPMHVGATLIFERGPLGDPSGGVDIDLIRRFVGARLQYVPRYRQRLEWIPIERHPVWVDDQHFNLEYHIRHTALPRPGTEVELQRLAARVWSQRLDRGKPLWECWVVEGLEGDRFALVTKVHHCMIDGLAGVDLLKILLAPSPDDVVGEPDEYEPRPSPGRLELLRGEFLRRTQTPAEMGRRLREFVEESRDISADLQHRVRAVAASAGSGWFQNASPTPINGRVGPNRRVVWWETDLERLKEIKNALGGTVNDAVIAVVAGALRRYLAEDRGVEVDELDFRAMIPVSIRSAQEQGELGNRITMWLLDLPIGEKSAAKRMRAVSAETLHLKDTDQALGAAMLTQGASWTPSTLLGVAARVAASAARPFNLTVTNVPGPQIPLFMLGARMTANYPVVPLWVNHGLSLALFSYDGRVAWCLFSDWDIVPDLDVVGRRFEEALAELNRSAAASVRARKAAAERRRAKG